MDQLIKILPTPLVILFLLASTNPDQSAYKVYATKQAISLAKEQCLPLDFISKGLCLIAAEAATPIIQPLITATSSRQNFILFSIYKSEISVADISFNAKVESIGVGGQFIPLNFLKSN
jgi:Domain of unknown function (DUF4359)